MLVLPYTGKGLWYILVRGVTSTLPADIQVTISIAIIHLTIPGMTLRIAVIILLISVIPVPEIISMAGTQIQQNILSASL